MKCITRLCCFLAIKDQTKTQTNYGGVAKYTTGGLTTYAPFGALAVHLDIISEEHFECSTPRNPREIEFRAMLMLLAVEASWSTQTKRWVEDLHCIARAMATLPLQCSPAILSTALGVAVPVTFRRQLSGFDMGEIIKALCTVPEKKLVEVALAAGQLIGHFEHFNSFAYCAIIDAFKSLPSHKAGVISAHLLPLVEPNMNAIKISWAVRSFAVSEKCVPLAAALATKLVGKNGPNEFLLRVTTMALCYPKSLLTAMLPHVTPCSMTNLSDYAEHLQYIASVATIEIILPRDVIEIVLRHMPQIGELDKSKELAVSLVSPVIDVHADYL